MVYSVFTSSAADRGFEIRSGHTWYVLLLRKAHSTKEQEQQLVGSESAWNVRVERHV
jgi:hypothetical protein